MIKLVVYTFLEITYVASQVIPTPTAIIPGSPTSPMNEKVLHQKISNRRVPESYVDPPLRYPNFEFPRRRYHEEIIRVPSAISDRYRPPHHSGIFETNFDRRYPSASHDASNCK